MRLRLRIVVFLVGTVLVLSVVGLCWLYFYSGDLPNISSLAKYAPTTIVDVSDSCIGKSTAIPYEAIGSNVRNAISAVETSQSDPGVLKLILDQISHRNYFAGKRTLSTSIYIARSLCYSPAKPLRRDLAELRTAVQLERCYSRRQLFTAFANRVHFGPDLIGVHDASEFYFKKPPSELSVAEGALLTTLMYSPAMYSPIKHPDRALQRRNQIIEAMAANGTITVSEARSAESVPVAIVPTANTASAR